MRLIRFITLVLLLAGCEGDIVFTTPTPSDVTPTQENWTAPPPTYALPTATEKPAWDVSCVETGHYAINPNPCLSGVDIEYVNGRSYQVPKQYTLTISPDNEGVLKPLEINATPDGFDFDLRGFGGTALFTMHNIVLEALQCYVLTFDIYVNAEYTDYYNALTNFEFYVDIYVDGEPIPIGRHSWVMNEGTLEVTLEGSRPFVTAFHTARQNATVAIGFGPHIGWGNGLDGTRMVISSVVLEEASPLHCPGAGF